MKRILTLVAALLVIGILALIVLNRTDPAAGTAPAIAGAPASADRVARGEYLAIRTECDGGRVVFVDVGEFDNMRPGAVAGCDVVESHRTIALRRGEPLAVG